MSRNVKEANEAIFSGLDEFCATKGVALKNAGTPRWIESEHRHRYFLRQSIVRDCLNISGTRKIARIDLDRRTFFCTIGFENTIILPESEDIPVDAAFLTVILKEISPRPKASTAQIRQILEATDKYADPDYSGHDAELIGGLFPSIRIIATENYAGDATWKTFFEICIEEAELGESWIENDLGGTLKAICSLERENIPYHILCRSIFDGDPANFFLSLYRCLEALYAFSSAQELVEALSLTVSWGTVATVLEDKLGWHPREEGSMEQLLRRANTNDLHAILNALGKPATETTDQIALARIAGRRIYRLRNSIVHFRPAQHKIDLNIYSWTDICNAMAGIIFHVYTDILYKKSNTP